MFLIGRIGTRINGAAAKRIVRGPWVGMARAMMTSWSTCGRSTEPNGRLLARGVGFWSVLRRMWWYEWRDGRAPAGETGTALPAWLHLYGTKRPSARTVKGPGSIK